MDLVSLKQGVVDADEIQSVQLLGAEDELEWHLGPEALRVHLPEKPDYANAFPVRLIFKGTLP